MISVKNDDFGQIPEILNSWFGAKTPIFSKNLKFFDAKNNKTEVNFDKKSDDSSRNRLFRGAKLAIFIENNLKLNRL